MPCGKLKEKLPLLLALAPVELPFTVMEENGSRSPVSEKTVPNIFWAESAEGKITVRNSRYRNLIMYFAFNEYSGVIVTKKLKLLTCFDTGNSLRYLFMHNNIRSRKEFILRVYEANFLPVKQSLPPQHR